MWNALQGTRTKKRAAKQLFVASCFELLLPLAQKLFSLPKKYSNWPSVLSAWNGPSEPKKVFQSKKARQRKSWVNMMLTCAMRIFPIFLLFTLGQDGLKSDYVMMVKLWLRERWMQREENPIIRSAKILSLSVCIQEKEYASTTYFMSSDLRVRSYWNQITLKFLISVKRNCFRAMLQNLTLHACGRTLIWS